MLGVLSVRGDVLEECTHLDNPILSVMMRREYLVRYVTYTRSIITC